MGRRLKPFAEPASCGSPKIFNFLVLALDFACGRLYNHSTFQNPPLPWYTRGGGGVGGGWKRHGAVSHRVTSPCRVTMSSPHRGEGICPTALSPPGRRYLSHRPLPTGERVFVPLPSPPRGEGRGEGGSPLTTIAAAGGCLTTIEILSIARPTL